VPRPNFELYLVTDRTQTRGRDLLWILEQALDGGVQAIQLREKDLGGKDLFFLAEKISKLCQIYQCAFFINERIDIALAVDACGVQLGSASVPVEVARQLLGAEKMIGVSTHSLQEALEAEQRSADFVLFGPVFFTPSKAVYGAPQGLTRLKEIVEKVSIPIYAIGGIKPENIRDVRHAGAFGVSLISAVMSADTPQTATRDLLKIVVTG
jgi:thiamine-phosphate pyrophosphorylase